MMPVSFRTRYTRSLLTADLLPPQRADARERAGHPLWRRYLASLFDVPLAPRNAARPQPRTSTGTAAVPPARPVQKKQQRLLLPLPAQSRPAFPTPQAGKPVYGAPAYGRRRSRRRPALAMAALAAAAAAVSVFFILQTSQNPATGPAPTGSPSPPVIGGPAPTVVPSPTGGSSSAVVGTVDSPAGWTWLLDGPAIGARHIARLPNGTRVGVLCAVHGGTTSPTGGVASGQWYLIGNPSSGYLPSRYVRVPAEPINCP